MLRVRSSMPADDELIAVFGAPIHWTIDQGRRCWALHGEPSCRFVLVDEEDELVAAGGAVLPELHHRRFWAHVEVAPTARRRGIGAHAMSELRRLLPEHSRLRVKCEVGSAGERFATKHGLIELQRTQTVVVDRASAGTVGAAGNVRVMAALDAGDEVVDAWRRFYVDGHRWDPPAHQPLGFWRSVLGGPGDTVLVWPSEPPYRGLAILGSDGSWTGGAVGRDDPDAVRIADVLLRSAAAGHLEVELDEWMIEVAAALAGFATSIVDRAVILGDRLA